jgi:uncharacterized protein (DUF305 family)
MTFTRTRTGALAPLLAAALGATGCGAGGDHEGHDGSRSTTAVAGAASPAAVDRAFVAQMVPHHEMAIDMARFAPTRAQHEELRRLGRSILDTQSREVAELRAAGRRLGVAAGATAMGHGAMGHGGHDGATDDDAETLGLPPDAMGMSMSAGSLRTARPFDRAFIDMMIPHHQGAIRMARAELRRGGDADLKRIATAIVRAQEREIARMNAWREAWYGAPSPAGGVPTT